MKSILRICASAIASVILSVLASWALRRLLWSTAGGEEEDEKRRGPVIVVVPIMAGNQWVIGQQPVHPDAASASRGTPAATKSSQKEQ
jgi:hypothetical protein